MATTMKLTPAQQRIVDALRNGAQIRYSRGSNTQHLYVDGVKGKAVRYDVFVALRDAGIVKLVHDGFWTRTYGLSDDAVDHSTDSTNTENGGARRAG